MVTRSLESRNSVYSNVFWPKTHLRQGILYTPLLFDLKLFRGKEFSILYCSSTQNSLEVRNSVYSFIIWPKTHRRQGIQYTTFFYPKVIGGKEFSILHHYLTWNLLEARNSVYILHYFLPKTHWRLGIQYAPISFGQKLIGGKEFSILHCLPKTH